MIFTTTLFATFVLVAHGWTLDDRSCNKGEYPGIRIKDVADKTLSKLPLIFWKTSLIVHSVWFKTP